MRKLLIMPSLLVAVSTVSMTSASALTAQQQQHVTTRCNARSSKVDARLTKLGGRLDKTAATYAKEDAKVQALITKANTAGLSTTKAQADLTTWQNQTTSVRNAKNQFKTDLTNAKNAPCANDSAAYKSGLQTAKSDVTNIQSLKATKRAFFTSTLKPDLVSLRQQLKAKNTSH